MSGPMNLSLSCTFNDPNAANAAPDRFSGTIPPAPRRPFAGDSECRTLSPDLFELYKRSSPTAAARAFKFILLSPQEAEKVLNQNAVCTLVKRESNRTVRWDNNTIAANPINEDRLAVHLIPGDFAERVNAEDDERGFWQRWAEIRDAHSEHRDGRKVVKQGIKGDDDLLMLSVIDGHGGGPEMAELVAEVLHACIVYALARLGGRDNPVKVLNDVFVELQDDILRLPQTLVRDHLPDPFRSFVLPDPAPALMALTPLVCRGACVSTAVVDNASKNLYVANLGDCRVVGGWFDGKTGKWRCDVMSDLGDANARNPKEVEILRQLHPEDPDVVICDTGRGQRLLGEGEPTRAMGDCGHQLTEEAYAELGSVLDVELHTYKVGRQSPPYMIKTPDIVVRDLQPESGEELKFIILAVDGLWDHLSSEEACLLTAAYYDDPARGPVSKKDLPGLYSLVKQDQRTFPAQPLPGTTEANSQGEWLFEDNENAATHLIRNAFGQGDSWELQRYLSLTAPKAKLYRDDTTVIVVKFD